MKISLKDQAKISPALPMQCAATFTGSALPLEFVDIPGEIGGAAVVAVAATVTNADGAAATAPCEHAGEVWRVTFAASCFEHYGFIERGVSVALTLRDGSGNERGMVLAVGDLEVKRSSPSAAPGDPEKSYQIKGEDIFVKTRVIDDVQHYARQEMSYDAEMGAWGADWLGDYILVDGEFVPFQAAGGTAATVATALLALLLVPFSAFGITATKEYVDRRDGEIAALSTNIVTSATNAVLDAARGYTDTAISQIPEPDFSTNNTALVETIEATAPAPGNYAAVSNAAVYAAITNALQDTAIESNRVNIASNRVAISTLNDTKLDKSGGTMTGSLTLPGISLTNGTILYGLSVFELISYRGGTLAIMEQIAPEFSAASSYEVGQLVIQYSRLRKCSTAGTGNAAVFADATVEDVLAELRAGKADKTDIDAAISPTSPAFSNAVLSVGLGIDTNTVAVINELVDSAHDLPVTGATSVGALLLALAAAVAALKKKFGYDTEDSAASATIALSTRTFPVVDATAKTSADTIAVTMPSSTADGKVSDMCLRIDTGASVPALTFDLSANVFIPASGDDAWGTLEASSHNVFSFTSSGTQTVAVTDAANGNAVTNVTKRVWIVGRVTAAIVAAETINES